MHMANGTLFAIVPSSSLLGGVAVLVLCLYLLLDCRNLHSVDDLNCQ